MFSFGSKGSVKRKSAAKAKSAARSNRRRRLGRSLEQLESRQLLASLTGEVWADTNSDGIRDTTESGVIDARVYLDLNDNQQFNSNEPFVRTDGTGQYVFDLVPAGNHIVRAELLTGQTQTTPQSYFGITQVAGVNGSESRLFEMNGAGAVSLLGANSQTSLDGLVETNAGTLIGIDSQTNTVYQIDKATGASSQLSAAGVDLQSGLAYDSQSDTIYATANVNNALQLMIVDSSSGQVSEPIVTVNDVRVSNFGSTFFDFDVASQTAVAIPRNGGFFSSTLDQRSDGAVLGLQGNTLIEFTVSSAGSSGQQVSSLSQSITSISFGANDQLFGVSTSPSAFHQIDPVSGSVTAGVPITFSGASISGVAGFDIAADGTHYLVDSTHLYTFDPVSGVATQAPNRGLPSTPIFTSLSVAADGSLYATLFDTTTPVASIDPVTGLATRLGNSPLGAPYSAIVAGDSFATAAPLSGANASALTFDSSSGRIVGFDDASDSFFAFDTLGRGRFLANAARPLNSSSLAFNGVRFLMFDSDDAAGTSLLSVDPETGSITPLLQSSAAVAPAALDFSIRSTAHRVTVDASQTVAGLGFGLGGAVNRLAIGEGLFINELVIDPLFENRETHQAIELRGQPNSTIAADTYFVLVKENGLAGSQSSPGHIRGVFDLSNQRFGANGFLVILPQGSPYPVHPQSSVLRSTAPGFGGLPGNIYTDDNANSNAIAEVIASTGFFLVQSDVPPTVGADVDTNDDGFADVGGLMGSWNVHDSIALHPFVGRGDQTYADIVFVERGAGTVPELIRPEGVPQVVRQGTDYAGRLGDSIGNEEEDWIVGTAIDISESNQPFQLGLDDGIFGVPIPEPFKARKLDHFGESNFVGGVRGTVRVAPLVDSDTSRDPAENVTVLADTNRNGRRDVLTYRLTPDSYSLGTDLTHAIPGVTVSTVTPGFNPPTGSTGFKIETVAESFFNPQGNKIFSHAGIGFFNQDSRHFRASFYRPAKSVSIVGISAIANAQTIMRLDAYDANGILLGSDTSQVLTGGQREVLSLSFPDDVIAYAEAYSVTEDVVVNGVTISGSPFGRLDDFSYSQFEASAKTDKFGEYEITNLFPDNYQITFINSPTNRQLSGAQSVPITVLRHENFILEPNLEPKTADLNVTIPENTAAGTLLGTIEGTDDNGQPTFSILTGGTGFLIDSVTGELTVGPGAILDFETTPVITLQVAVTDALKAVSVSQVTIQLTDVNEAPIIQPTQITIAEDATVGSAIGRVLASDRDASPNDRLLSYRLDGGTGVNFFAVDPTTGIITLTDSEGADFENAPTRTLIITVSDNGSTPQSTTFTQTINVTNANDAPQLVIPTITINENTTGVIGRLSVIDQDQDQSHIYGITGGNGAGLLEVRANGDIAVRQGANIDFETQASLQLNVSVIDNGVPTLSDFGVVNITVLDVNEPAVATILTPSVGENAQPGDVVSIVNLTDAEGSVGNYTVALTDDLDSGLFELRPISSQVAGVAQFELVVKVGATFDFETRRSVAIAFQIDDQTNASPSSRIEKTIAVLNQNDPPSVRTTSITVSEAAVPGSSIVLARLRFDDVDPGETLTSRIVGGTGANRFVLNPNTHELTLAAGEPLDADVPDPTLTLIVEVSDSGGVTATGEVLVNISNVNEAPFFTVALGNLGVVSGQNFSLPLNGIVSDPEGGVFQISVFDSFGGLPSFVEYDPVTRVLTAVPSILDQGSYELTVRAFELGSTSVSDLNFTLVVLRGSQPFTNQRNRADVDNNKVIAPSDVLRVINFLAEFRASSVANTTSFPGFVDVNGDGFVTPLDVLIVINELFVQGINSAQREAIDMIDTDREDSVDEAILDFAEPTLF